MPSGGRRAAPSCSCAALETDQRASCQSMYLTLAFHEHQRLLACPDLSCLAEARRAPVRGPAPCGSSGGPSAAAASSSLRLHVDFVNEARRWAKAPSPQVTGVSGGCLKMVWRNACMTATLVSTTRRGEPACPPRSHGRAPEVVAVGDLCEQSNTVMGVHGQGGASASRSEMCV